MFVAPDLRIIFIVNIITSLTLAGAAVALGRYYKHIVRAILGPEAIEDDDEDSDSDDALPYYYSANSIVVREVLAMGRRMIHLFLSIEFVSYSLMRCIGCP